MQNVRTYTHHHHHHHHHHQQHHHHHNRDFRTTFPIFGSTIFALLSSSMGGTIFALRTFLIYGGSIFAGYYGTETLEMLRDGKFREWYGIENTGLLHNHPTLEQSPDS